MGFFITSSDIHFPMNPFKHTSEINMLRSCLKMNAQVPQLTSRSVV